MNPNYPCFSGDSGELNDIGRHPATNGTRPATIRDVDYRFCDVADLSPNSFGKPFAIFIVSTLTRMTWPISRVMYCGSSSRFGSLVIPLRVSLLKTGSLG